VIVSAYVIFESHAELASQVGIMVARGDEEDWEVFRWQEMQRTVRLV
jgi:hypothetical protein